MAALQTQPSDESRAYARASLIMDVAMGADVVGRGRGVKHIRRAEQDPLAFWLGVESIMDLWREAGALAAQPHEAP